MIPQAKAVGFGASKLEKILGPGWQEVEGEYEAYGRFSAQIASLSRFTGLYLLRKRNPNRIAYGLFGLSSSAHGIALLSDATARDLHDLAKSRGENAPTLFDDDPHVSDSAWWYEQLKQALRTAFVNNPEMPGKQLMVKLFELDSNARFFGRFTERHFNQARKDLRQERDNAEAK